MLIGSIGAKGFSLEGYIARYVWFQILSFIKLGILVGCCAGLSRFGIPQRIWSVFSIYAWPVSMVARRFAMARFFRSLSLLIVSGVPISHAIERSADATANPIIAADLVKAIPRVHGGRTLAEAFAGSQFFTPVARQMLLVGEQSGKLDEQLSKLAQYHSDEAAHAVDIAVRAGEVLIILAVCCVVGYVIISFYGRLYGGLYDVL